WPARRSTRASSKSPCAMPFRVAFGCGGWENSRASVPLREIAAMTERSVFLAALDLDDAAERASYLDTICGTDAPLRHRIEKLLRAHREAGSLLERPAVQGELP